MARANKKYYENPDFILEIEIRQKKYFLIIDAKYKIYNPQKFNQEMGNLSYKYLHKIGTTTTKEQVLGLYTLSLNQSNSYESIYKNTFDLFQTDTVFPQIGKIELNPIKITINNNPLQKVIGRYIHLCTNPSFLSLN